MVFLNVSRGVAAASLLVALAGCNTDSTLDPKAAQRAADVAVVQTTCPGISLRDGTASYRTYASGGKDDPEKVIYQASLADTTRACTKNDATLTITAMVQGRIIAGPMGKAGNIVMPIRVSVVDGDNVLYSELTKYEQTLADPAVATQFVFTKDVNIPVQGDLSGLARVYIGFDEGKSKQ
ncbi:hypothetical protein ACQQ2Q_03250 [Agrobacterium sp. ES01]|uniref:hypothetical protein n=1 Tax=Agrobacterium sp. ES01 TaxID=3420714 RepID=UPI003D0EC456